MDDQQLRMRKRLNWLGGILDGEGTVTITKRSSTIKKVQNNASPVISIINTDMKIIDEVVNILKEFSLPFYVHTKTNSKHLEWKIKYVVLFAGMKRCLKVIPVLKDYTIGKKYKLEAMMDWITYRLSLPKNATYTEMDFDYINKVNADPKEVFSLSSETNTPDSLINKDEDRVRTSMAT